MALRVEADRLYLLDQSRLPQEQRWLAIDDVDALVEAIHALRTRGADDRDRGGAAGGRAGRARRRSRRRCCGRRPPAPRPADRGQPDARHGRARRRTRRAGLARGRLASAEALHDGDRALCDALAAHGAALIGPGERILTHCNTGGLATAGIGTALGVIRRAHEQEKGVSVWVDETRPLLQGARLTAWELGELGVPYRLITDSMAAGLMATGRVDRVIVGADRIAANGDVANKIGTYGLAVLARHHGVPFAVAAPHTTLDPACATGTAIPIEQRAAEVRGGRAPPVNCAGRPPTRRSTTRPSTSPRRRWSTTGCWIRAYSMRRPSPPAP